MSASPSLRYKLPLHGQTIKKKLLIHDHIFFVTNTGNFYSCSKTNIQLLHDNVVSFACTTRVCYLAKTGLFISFMHYLFTQDGVYVIYIKGKRRKILRTRRFQFPITELKFHFKNIPGYASTDICDICVFWTTIYFLMSMLE
jgi:hypothetical protein